MEYCKVVERPQPPALPTPTAEELLANSLQARVVPGETPPPEPQSPPAAETGYNFTNYIYRGWEGQPGIQPPELRAKQPFDSVVRQDWPGDYAVTGIRDRVLGRWYVSLTVTGSRDDRRVRPRPIQFDNGPRRTYLPVLTGDKSVIVKVSGSIMEDNGGMRRLTSPLTRYRMIRSHYENPHYTDVRNGSVVVAASGSLTPYSPRVTIGCTVPQATIATNPLRQVWRDQANPLWSAGIMQSDWIFHGSTGEEMWIDELYRQIDWTLDSTKRTHPTGSWELFPYYFTRPRSQGDFIQDIPWKQLGIPEEMSLWGYDIFRDNTDYLRAKYGSDTISEWLKTIAAYRSEARSRGINYLPFTNPTPSAVNPQPQPYPDTGSGDWDAYRTEIDWLNRTYAQPQYAGTTGVPDAATTIPAVLSAYLVGTATVWNRINRDGNMIRTLHNSLPDSPGFDLQPPRFVKLVVNDDGTFQSSGGTGTGTGTMQTAYIWNPLTGQLEGGQVVTITNTN